MKKLLGWRACFLGLPDGGLSNVRQGLAQGHEVVYVFQEAIYEKRVGAGKTIYAPLALSTKAGMQSDVTDFIRALITENVG